MKRPHIVIFAVIAVVVAAPVLAQMGKGRMRGGGGGAPSPDACAIGRWPECGMQPAKDRGLFETGLSPAFPAHAQCRGIDEGYAINYEGKRGREQYHGGIDMPAPWGTPMIAAAAGTVVAKYAGEDSFRGIEIVLRHSPEDTGIPLWIYTQYAHCAEMPALDIGRRVRMGESLCPTGNTGIRPRGAKRERRPAIHFAVFYSASESYSEVRSTVIPADGYWMDPVALFRNKLPLDSVSMKALPDAEKRIPIPVMFGNGETFPADTKLVWPYACAPQGSPQAQPRYGKKGGAPEAITPSGLQPLFPEQARCPEITSPYGSQTRYDGSFRPKWAFGGYHGGIDIGLDEGTPLLALAAGTVAGKGEGGRLEGIYLWLRHAPEDTGLGYWVYAKYQHLESASELDVGAKVAMGQTVARSGKTGTVGGHYGMTGYPHLHLTTLKSSSGDESVAGSPGLRAGRQGLVLFDPLAIYQEAGGNTSANGVPIPYASTGGKVTPPGTRVVWPVACRPK